LQFIIKDVSKEMANPTRGSWIRLKKVVRYLLNREVVVWEFPWQVEGEVQANLLTDSDWGGTNKDRKSTSGGVWMLGKHCIRTWSASQGAVALSSAEAELYAMIEGVTRAKGLANLARELGYGDLSEVITIGVDSQAAKQFVSRRGLGRMKHLEMRFVVTERSARWEVDCGKGFGFREPGGSHD
jgi:hypothetical protein